MTGRERQFNGIRKEITEGSERWVAEFLLKTEVYAGGLPVIKRYWLTIEELEKGIERLQSRGEDFSAEVIALDELNARELAEWPAEISFPR